MIRSVISLAHPSVIGGVMGGCVSSGVIGSFGVAASVVAAPWFLPVAVVTGAVIGGLAAKKKSEDEIQKVNSNFE